MPGGANQGNWCRENQGERDCEMASMGRKVAEVLILLFAVYAVWSLPEVQLMVRLLQALRRPARPYIVEMLTPRVLRDTELSLRLLLAMDQPSSSVDVIDRAMRQLKPLLWQAAVGHARTIPVHDEEM